MYPPDAFRDDVLVSTAGLEIVWREAHARYGASEPGTTDHDLWHQALVKLVVALEEAELMVSTALPSMGRRQWADRTPDLPGAGRARSGAVLYLDARAVRPSTQ